MALDGGKEWPADVRFTAFRDAERWAVVFEELVFFPPSPGHRGIVNLLYKSGNCVAGRLGAENGDEVRVTGDGPDKPAFTPPIGLEVNPEAKVIRIRGKEVGVDISEAALLRRHIPPPKGGTAQFVRDGQLRVEAYPPKARGQHLLWSLLPENRNLLLATEAEKRRRLPLDLPKFMQLEEWNHPPLLSESLLPSDSETLRMVAEAIARGDPSRYRPRLRPNTNWQNWLKYPRI